MCSYFDFISESLIPCRTYENSGHRKRPRHAPYAHSAEEWRNAMIMRCAMRRIWKVSAKCANASFFHQFIAWASALCRHVLSFTRINNYCPWNYLQGAEIPWITTLQTRTSAVRITLETRPMLHPALHSHAKSKEKRNLHSLWLQVWCGG
jgi:hypothetical protein